MTTPKSIMFKGQKYVLAGGSAAKKIKKVVPFSARPVEGSPGPKVWIHPSKTRWQSGKKEPALTINWVSFASSPGKHGGVRYAYHIDKYHVDKSESNKPYGLWADDSHTSEENGGVLEIGNYKSMEDANAAAWKHWNKLQKLPKADE